MKKTKRVMWGIRLQKSIKDWYLGTCKSAGKNPSDVTEQLFAEWAGRETTKLLANKKKIERSQDL